VRDYIPASRLRGMQRFWNALVGLLGLFFYCGASGSGSSIPTRLHRLPPRSAKPAGQGLEFTVKIFLSHFLAIPYLLVYPEGASNAILVLSSFCS
jgi:hypothetical protein